MKSEKVAGIAGSASGLASVLGSWQICHAVCLMLIALLGTIGLTITGMPLQFLTRIAIPLWVTALVLLGIVFVLYVRKQCIARWMLIVNTGLVVAGTPFGSGIAKVALWSVGGILVAVGIVDLIWRKRTCKHE